MSATIRVPDRTYQALKALAARRTVSIGRLVEEDLAMRADPAASAAFDAEVAAWDATLLDGLEEFPYEWTE